jgi:hypothetical protein
VKRAPQNSKVARRVSAPIGDRGSLAVDTDARRPRRQVLIADLIVAWWVANTMSFESHESMRDYIDGRVRSGEYGNAGESPCAT